ncbi:hypothetical protein ACIP79_38745 [Streptomyces sp. NPDC088747]|uniref:hypothetical protein n=1 Tax=Streptomyces sp. NPDC088747 TaxID=3365886 RepID=UPI0037F122CB
MSIVTGKDLLAFNLEDFTDYARARRDNGRTVTALPVAHDILHAVGGLKDSPPTLREAQARGHLTPAELIDRHPIANRAIRDVLVHYLAERSAVLDYRSLVNHAQMLADLFWGDLQRHHPMISMEDPARWASCPISEADIRGYIKETRHRQTRMAAAHPHPGPRPAAARPRCRGGPVRSRCVRWCRRCRSRSWWPDLTPRGCRGVHVQGPGADSFLAVLGADLQEQGIEYPLEAYRIYGYLTRCAAGCVASRVGEDDDRDEHGERDQPARREGGAVAPALGGGQHEDHGDQRRGLMAMPIAEASICPTASPRWPQPLATMGGSW